MRLEEIRKGVNRRLPGITHATRTIVETRLRAIVYEGELPPGAHEGGGADGGGGDASPGGGGGVFETPDGKGVGGGDGVKVRTRSMPARFSAAAFPSPVLSSSKKGGEDWSRSGRGGGRGGGVVSPMSMTGVEGEHYVDSPGYTVAGDSTPGRMSTGGSIGVGGGDSGVGAGSRMTTKEYIFATFNDPDFSPIAKYISMFILSLILLSTTTFIMDTRREYEGSSVLVTIEAVCIIIFTVEYVAKISTAPNRRTFFWGPMNLIDLIAIVPFYLEIIIIAASGGGSSGAPTGLLRLFRLFRVFRVLKLGARMKKLEVVASAVYDSLDMMGMLVFLLVLALVLFSTLIYFCEKGVWEGGDIVEAHGGDPFASIPRSFWWCMVTLMTVGYGDAYPVTVPGKIVASLTMISSVIITALPISVIGANFTQQWIVYKDNEGAKAREQTMQPTFIKLANAMEAHNFVLDEVLRAVEEMEILIEQETAHLRELFTDASEMVVDTVSARETRRNMLREFDARFEGLQDMREELDELLAFTELLSSSAFTSMLETCTNKNGRLVNIMDTCETIFGDVDTLVRKVNEVNERGLDLSSPDGERISFSRSDSGASMANAAKD